jgi:hypothetical protein
MKTAMENEAGSLHPKFRARLREASLFGAFTEVTTPRFYKYLLQPKHILRNGWLLDPTMELDQRSVRAYVLGDPRGADKPNAVGQRLEIDRQKRQATLMTFFADQKQTIRFDMTSLEVIDNRLN